MFMLPDPPSPQAETHELADFAELLALKQKTVSSREIQAYLGRVDDNDNNVGCTDDDDENADLLDESMNEIDRRSRACGGGYPFDLELSGTALRHNESGDLKSNVYRYLLLSTRLNMKSSRVHAGIDGTALLEELAAHVLRKYLGERAQSLVFGSSIGGSFKGRVETMCVKLCEGVGFQSLDGTKEKAVDDKLDAVAWVPFTDSLPGQIIVFAQCKTGTNWDGLINQLQPDQFVDKWLQQPILVPPLRAFCVSEAVDRSRWKSTCVSAGVLLDRCRLVDFCEGADQALVDRMVSWSDAASASVMLTRAQGRKRAPRKVATKS